MNSGPPPWLSPDLLIIVLILLIVSVPLLIMWKVGAFRSSRPTPPPLPKVNSNPPNPPDLK